MTKIPEDLIGVEFNYKTDSFLKIKLVECTGGHCVYTAYISDPSGFMANIGDITPDGFEWYSYVLGTRVSGFIEFSEIRASIELLKPTK